MTNSLFSVLCRFVPPYKKYLALNIIFNVLTSFLTLFSFAVIIPILETMNLTEAVDTVTVLTDDSLLRPGMKTEMPTIIDFNAPWCGPCKKLDAPMRKAAATFAGKARFYSANVDVLTATDEAFGINKSVPVVVVMMPDGSVKKYATLAPFISADELKNSDKAQAEQIIFDNLVVIITENL